MRLDTPSALFGAILFISAGALTLRATRAINLHRQCKRWPKVPATIQRSTVVEHSDSEGTAHRPQITFRYTIAGCDYISDRHTEGMPFAHTRDAAQAVAARFPVGAIVEVAIKPGQPDFAVLDTGVPHQWVIIRRVSLVMTLVGLGLLLTAILKA